MTALNKTLQHPVFGLLTCTYAYEVDPMWLPRFGLSAVPQPIGEIWAASRMQSFLGSSQALTLQIHSADWADVLAGRCKEGEFTALQVAAYERYGHAPELIWAQVREALLKHYHDCLEMIDYPGEGFSPVASVDPLFSQCAHWELRLRRQDSGPRRLQVSCECPWEEEHGFTAEFEDEQLVNVE